MNHPDDLNVKLTNGIMYVDKPAGLATHAPDLGMWGFCEFLQDRLQQKLFVVHRLDKTTSGAMAFATDKAVAEKIRQAFEAKKVHKKYWFLTAKKSTQNQFTVASEIEKQGKQFTSNVYSAKPNAKTVLTMVKRSPFFELWQAEPQTGKPHQVRLHARDCGLEILGDVTYGGQPFVRLCLHALELQFPGEAPWVCPAPRIFERLGLLKDPEVVEILTALDFRQRLYSFLLHRERSLRLIDFEVNRITMDALNEVIWLSWFRPEPPDQKWRQRFEFLSRMLDRPLVVQDRPDRSTQRESAKKIWIGDVPESWHASEDDVIYEFRKQSGESHGLFLDQRLNRRKIREFSPGKEILNLFCYTGGFSLCALKAGANSATSVDLSQNVIDWCKRNHELNGVADRAEFFASEALFFLERAKARNRKWDVIVCDPPIFGRSQKGTFRIEQDYKKLLKACHDVLKPKGTLFFSTHFSKWTQATLRTEIQKLFPSAKIKDGAVDLDYADDQALKSFWITF